MSRLKVFIESVLDGIIGKRDLEVRVRTKFIYLLQSSVREKVSVAVCTIIILALYRKTYVAVILSISQILLCTVLNLDQVIMVKCLLTFF